MPARALMALCGRGLVDGPHLPLHDPQRDLGVGDGVEQVGFLATGFMPMADSSSSTCLDHLGLPGRRVAADGEGVRRHPEAHLPPAVEEQAVALQVGARPEGGTGALVHERGDDFDLPRHCPPSLQRTGGRYRSGIDEDFCYITTTGRRTGNPHRIEILVRGRAGQPDDLRAGRRSGAGRLRPQRHGDPAGDRPDRRDGGRGHRPGRRPRHRGGRPGPPPPPGQVPGCREPGTSRAGAVRPFRWPSTLHF